MAAPVDSPGPDSPALARLGALGLELPPAPSAVAAYVPATVVPIGEGRLLVSVAGQVPVRGGTPTVVGTVPTEVSIDEARGAAEICALNLLAQLERAVGLDNVEQVTQVCVFVRCADDFSAQPKVADGASELLVNVLGERGRHARAAVGVNALPFGVPVEVTAVAVARAPQGGS